MWGDAAFRCVAQHVTRSRMEATQTVDDCFRHEYGRIVGGLVRQFGMMHLDLVEDAVQEAMVAALGTWRHGQMPMVPGAWLRRVARNKLVDSLRRRRPDVPLPDLDPAAPSAGPATVLRQEITSDELRMLFVCCDDALPAHTQLVLALKLLCGFTAEEIALRLFASEATVYKRLSRGRAKLRSLGRDWADRLVGTLSARSPAVRHVIYLVFNEGYGSSRAEEPIRVELCEEAMYLGSLLSGSPIGDEPETWALLAIMSFHAARMPARVDGAGGLLLLEEQNRNLWDRELITQGFRCLTRSARGPVFSRYHAEAAVAAEHCRARSFDDTNWAAVIDAYETLERFEPSPLHALNRAIAVAQLRGPEAGLEILHGINPPGWLLGYYLWDAVLGELERRADHPARARAHLERALDAAPTNSEKALIGRRLNECVSKF